MEPYHRRSNERSQGNSEISHRYPNNKERVGRFSSPGNGYRRINRWRNNPEYYGTMRNNAKSIGRETQNSYSSNPCFDNRPRASQFYHTGNSTASSNNRRRKIDHTNNDTVTNRQGVSFKNKTNLDIRDSEVIPSKKRRYSLPSNNKVVDSFNITEKSSNISDKISKTNKENQVKEQSKNRNDEKYRISKKCHVSSIPKPTEDAPKILKKNRKKVSDQNDISSLKTDQIKQFKILLCEISSKIKEGWQLDVTGSTKECLRNGEINFTKEAGSKKIYSFYDIKYISTSTTSSKDPKLNYLTFSRSLVKNYFQRYLNFFNNRPSDYLKEFEARCNIKLNIDCFDKQGIDIVCVGSNTYKLQIQERYKTDVEKLGLYEKFLSCCTLPKLADLIDNYMRKKKKAHFNEGLLRKYFFTFIAENIFEKKEERDKYFIKFHQDFIRDNNLSGSAKELRRLLSKRIQLTDEMKFTVSNVTFKKHEKDPIEPLPVERYNMFEHFFEICTFRIVDNDIDAIVKNTIGEKFIAIDDAWYLNAVQEGLHKVQGLGGLNSKLFQFLEREIHKCNVIKKQEESCFQQENIKFENIELEKIYQYLKEENRKVVSCLTKHMTITEHKLRQLCDEKFGYSENQESLFINDKVLFKFTVDVKQGFLSCSLKLLVVLLQEKSTADCAQLLNMLNDLIKESFLHKDKSIIVVLSTSYETLFRSKYPNISVVVDETLSPLKPESLNQLKLCNIVLHGHEMKIAELMDDAAIAELIKLPESLEQFLDENLVFKDIMMKPNGFGLKCYEIKLRDESNKICRVTDILNCNTQTAIILGESGIGKSVCLYELAQETCNEHVFPSECHFWLIQINIDKFLPLKGLIPQDSMNILELLASYLGLKNVQKKAFIMSIEGRLNLKLIFVIDGYDELHSVYKDFALELLHLLKNSSIKNMFIASRDSTIFESASGVSRYTIEFCEENKKQYCCKYFTRSAVYIGSLAKELTNTPLHLKMLQEINRVHEQVVPVNDLLDLYKKYTELNNNKDQIFTFLEPSAQRVLSTEDLKLLNFESQEENLYFTYPKNLEHVTFYEYFTAWWLSAKFMGKVEVRRKISNIVDRLVDKTSPVFLSTFLAPLILDELVDELAEYGCLNLLKALLIFKDKQRPDLHPIIKNNDTNACEVLRYLFEHYKPTNDYQLVKYVNQQINNETPIQLSCRLQKMDLACELMLVGADVRFLEQSSLINMTIHVIRKLIRGDSRFENIAGKLLELSSDALTHISQKVEYPRLMKYLLERGRETILEGLLAEKPNRKKLLTMCIEGKSPLELVSNSQWLNNFQRLEMYKYIIENAGDELQRKSKFFIEPVLRRACQTDSENIFNYFVDQYPESVNGFSNAALRGDRLSDVKFVVKISERKRTIDEEGNTLLLRAVKYGTSHEIIDFLIDREGVMEVNANHETLLHVAFKNVQKFPRIKYLIKRGASLLSIDKYGLYPWCYALLDRYRPYDRNEQNKIMRYLVNCKNIEPPGNTSIGSKSDAYKKEVMKKLEYFRDPPNYMRNFNANSGLLSSLRSEEEYFCRFLIVHGADVNARGTDGKTALHVALECKLYELAKLMLQNGAIFDIEDNKNMTPLRQLANSFDRSSECNRMRDILELAKKIFSDEKSLKTYLSVSSEELKRSSMRHIVNCRDRRGRTLFHVAVLTGNESDVRDVAELSKNCCSMLTDFQKLNVNDRDGKGRTPLQLAEFKNFNRVVDELRTLEAQSGCFMPHV